MKKFFYLILVWNFSFLIFPILFEVIPDWECCTCGPDPDNDLKIKILEILMYLIFVLGLLLILRFLLVILKNKKKVWIAFKENGKTVKDYFTLLVSNKKEIIFENSNYKYECTPSEIIKIKRQDKWKKFIIAVCTFFILGYLSFCFVRDIFHYHWNYCSMNVLCEMDCFPDNNEY